MEHHDHDTLNGPWAGGWLVAVGAAVVVAGIARALGDVGMPAAFVLGSMVFGVFGALLGSGGVELTPLDHGNEHGAGHH